MQWETLNKEKKIEENGADKNTSFNSCTQEAAKCTLPLWDCSGRSVFAAQIVLVQKQQEEEVKGERWVKKGCYLWFLGLWAFV